jgi:hypothetical protein
MRLDRRPGVVGLALWTAVNAGWSYALSTRGAAEPAHPNPVAPSAAEHPAPATPSPDAREAVLAEMRVMLQAVQGALQAGERGDSAAVHTLPATRCTDWGPTDGRHAYRLTWMPCVIPSLGAAKIAALRLGVTTMARPRAPAQFVLAPNFFSSCWAISMCAWNAGATFTTRAFSSSF